MKTAKNILLIFLIFILSVPAKAQENLLPDLLLLSDSLTSGNHKDVLSNFFNLALKNIAGDDKEIIFSSNLFAIMLKKNPDLDIDKNFKRYTAARNSNVDLKVSLDDNEKFGGFTFGLKYAIVNKRDYIISDSFLSTWSRQSESRNILFKETAKKIARAALPEADDDKLNKELNDFAAQGSTEKFSDLDERLQQFMIESSSSDGAFKLPEGTERNNFSIEQSLKNTKDSIVLIFQNKGLLTSTLDLKSYTDNFQLSDVKFGLQYLKGLSEGDKVSDFEIDAKANATFADDSTKANRDLRRAVISGEAGINWVLKTWGKKQSMLEFELSSSINYITTGVYDGEDKDLFTLNGTLRFRISESLWIPIQFKYDPETANVFGFFNITSNFTWLGKNN